MALIINITVSAVLKYSLTQTHVDFQSNKMHLWQYHPFIIRSFTFNWKPKLGNEKKKKKLLFHYWLMNVIPKNESVCFFKLQFYAQIKKKGK